MLTVALLLLFVGTCTCSSDVPVLIWSQSRPMSSIPQVNVGSTVKSSEFSQNYLSPLTSDKNGNLVVFLQQKLSVQDFTQYADVYNTFSDGGAFKNVKSLMDDNFSIHLPAVSSPVKALQSLKKGFEGKVHEVMTAAGVDDLDLDPGMMNLIIVHLSPAAGVKSEEEAIASNDNQIGDVVRRLNKRDVKYTALYTARSAVQTQKEESSVKRRLLALDSFDEVNNGAFLNITCMFFFVRGITVFVDKDGKNMTTLLNETANFVDTGSECDNNTARLMFDYKDDVGGLAFSFMFDMTDKNTTDWQIENMTVGVEVIGANGSFSGNATMNTKKMNVWAPKDFSYHCSRLGPIVNVTGDNTTTINVTLTFDGLQLQPFNIMNNKFSDGWDCVPFFTEGIWMGIISMFLLTSILLYGFTMLSSIRTMDRFDDTKGKTITVNVSD